MPAYQPNVAALAVEVMAELGGGLAEVTDLTQLEELVRKVGLHFARRLAEVVLEGRDQQLSQERPSGWRVVAIRPRTLESMVGPLRLKRRLYRDPQGKWRYLLDEELKVAPRVRITPELQRLIVEFGGHLPFERASRLVREFLPTAPARSTLHRHLGQVGQARQQADERLRQEVFSAGQDTPGERKVPVLMIEADGKWVRLQRTPGQRSMEVKLALAYEGWEREGLERWRLRDKQVYVTTGDGDELWEGLSARLAQHYDLSQTRVVIGGDAATWVKYGLQHFPDSVWQLDRFHLARPLHEVLPEEEAVAAYREAGRGNLEIALAAVRKSKHRKAAGVARYLVNQQEGLLDCRERAEFADLGLHGLGATEGNIDKVLATRMGKRGMAWTPTGARRMGKVLQAIHNGELEQCLTARRRDHDVLQPIKPLRREAATAAPCFDPEAWLRAPVLTLPTGDDRGALIRRMTRPLAMVEASGLN